MEITMVVIIGLVLMLRFVKRKLVLVVITA